MRERYTQISTDKAIAECPVCGGKAELWRYAATPDGPATKAVMCKNGDPIIEGNSVAIYQEGCLLFMPPEHFYQATEREAIKYWNEYAKALLGLQRKNAGKAVP